MKPNRLQELVGQGKVEKFPEGQVFYSLDFKEEFYVVKQGYVKRYAVMADGTKAIESIYGPGYFFPLTPVFGALWNYNLSNENNTYVYQSMSDVEIQGISMDKLESAIQQQPELYADLLYEAGRRLRANINRLASNALKDDYMKVTHQLVYLAEEFGEVQQTGLKTTVTISAPLTPVDMAEQLNISADVAEAIMERLQKQKLISLRAGRYTIADLELLKGSASVATAVIR